VKRVEMRVEMRVALTGAKKVVYLVASRDVNLVDETVVSKEEFLVKYWL
jgi:hypothetical protein